MTLLADGGREAVSTRAVSAAAGVQAPAIYRLFGDKRGLLDAAAIHAFSAYLANKARHEPSEDPVADLRAGWDEHVDFGLCNPDVYALMYEQQRSGPAAPAVLAATDVLAGHIRRIAEAGRLRVPEERAALLVHAAGRGTVLSLIAVPADQRDRGLSELARDAVIAAISTDAPAAADAGPAGVAIALRALLPRTTMLSAQERGLLREWLDRIADPG